MAYVPPTSRVTGLREIGELGFGPQPLTLSLTSSPPGVEDHRCQDGWDLLDADYMVLH